MSVRVDFLELYTFLSFLNDNFDLHFGGKYSGESRFLSARVFPRSIKNVTTLLGVSKKKKKGGSYVRGNTRHKAIVFFKILY